MKAWAAAACAVSVLLLVSISPAGGAATGRTLSLAAPVESISADGGRVAFHVGALDKRSCDSVSIWTPSSGSVVDVRGDPCNDPYRFQDLTLAGTTAVWWDFDTGNHVYCSDVYTATIASPKAHPLGICDGTEGDTYYEFAGDGTIVAIADYSVCLADCVGNNGSLLPDGDYAVEVRSLVGGKLRTVLPPVDFRRFLDAENRRVATIEPKATLTVYDARGAKLWSRGAVTGVYGGWIVGNSVVLHQTRAVRVYSPTGVGTARPLPRGAQVDGVAGGLAVYTVGSTVRLLRLTDGRDRKLVTVKGLVGAQITPAGVFYAYNLPGKSARPGRVTFVPIGAALQVLS
jgi:hypothetical protein